MSRPQFRAPKGDRWECSTVRIQTSFGSLYGHIEHSGGRVQGISLSFQQRHEDSAVGKALHDIADALTREIEDINKRARDNDET